ncbi:glycerophosphodiester phosphodiesterase family protein [Rubripirellula reticaptiva]|uniref:Putative glycerophosphoryl diester phosphodiesterase 1 n=1 Tax=Rubripirellula reticaptiva TaxID=2528013 RepID=A0A5C6EDB4_9BACT|nr:glycerophosphodiester phosphodiesterase family protein [Rubripirellula reticaptiva]TWU46620.1 putative glycerophosphoryl diester phosphodiesterase 1 [Rubripirellula reticaptiva]
MKKTRPTTPQFASSAVFAIAALLSLQLATPGFAENPMPQDAGAQVSEVEVNATGSPATAVQINGVQIAAHRGGYETDKADNAPENSIANIRNCQIKGYELYETDIQRTQDGHFVIVHDPTIDRETTGSGAASKMSLEELKTLHKKFRDGTVSEHRVATLDEFLVEGKDRVLFKADLKPGVNQYFKEIMELVARRQAFSGIVFRVPYRDADLFDAYQTNGLPFSRDLLMFMVSNKNQVDDVKQRFNPTMVQVNVSKNDPANPQTLELIRYATSKGFLVETHAEGTEQDWRQLIQAGVRIFHTNKPAKMKAFLRQMEVENAD